MILIFDTETTDKKDGEIIEAAWVSLCPDPIGPEPAILNQYHGRFRPSRASTFGAMAVHHILPCELEHCPPSASFTLPADTEFLIGHSIDFDWTAAGSPADVCRIDTHAIAQWLWPDATGYSQTALLYLLDGPTPATKALVRNAHGAMADVQINYLLLKHILRAKPEIRTWGDLWAFSEACRVPRTCPLKRWEGVLLADMDYSAIDWCLRQSWLDPYFRKGLERVLEERGQPAWEDLW